MTEFPLSLATSLYSENIAYQDANGFVTYAKLYEDVIARANQLNSTETSNQRFAFCPRNDYTTLVDLWAIWLVGAAACPLSHRYPDERRQHITTKLAADWLPSPQPTPGNKTFAPSLDPDRPATIILSSGSTGDPKAIVHSLRAHIASAKGSASRIPLGPGDRWLWSLPAFHVGGLSIPIRCANSGATVCGVLDSESSVGQLIAESSPTHISLVPTQLQRLLDHKSDLSSIEAALVGGMAVPSSLIQLALDRGISIHTTYGMTEMASQVTTTHRIESVTPSSGTALPHCEVRISLDDEIMVRGESLCLGVLRNGTIDSVVNEEGWFATRDRGRFDDQESLVLLGRVDNMFISGGENIHPEAIERAILNLPQIKQAVVVPVDDPEFGARPVAFVDALVMEPEKWDAELRLVLAGFEIPKRFHPWPDEAMLAIKPDRKLLREIAIGNRKP